MSSAGYLGAQLFAGFMYIAAAICLLFLRVWKIRDNERVAAQDKAAALTDEDAAHVDSPQSSSQLSTQMPLLQALVAWKRV